jgi:hypothetical protein
LDIVRPAAGAAQIDIGEELPKRYHAADQALLMAIPQHRLDIFAVGLPLQAACDAVQRTTGHEAAKIQVDLLLWLPAALDAGMVTMTG